MGAPPWSAATVVSATEAHATETPAADNIAFVFVKPHACTPAMLELVVQRLHERGVEVVRSGHVNGAEVDARGIIDSHYASIARIGMERDVLKIAIGVKEAQSFFAGYDKRYDDALAEGSVHSAATAIEAMDVNPSELLERCLAAGYVKLRSGLYCAKLCDHAGRALYVLNGFYARMREKFVAQGVVVNWFVVRFDSSRLSWRDFRREVIGATNPPDAVDGSLRAEGLKRWEELGFAAEPNYQDNGVHASASPLEALRERVIWLGDDPATDPFGASLREQGMHEDLVRALIEDPAITVGGGGKPSSAFDCLEDVDTPEALKALLTCSVVASD